MADAPAAEWERSARTALSEAGHRAGGAREAVVGLLARQDCCLSAQEISDRIEGRLQRRQAFGQSDADAEDAASERQRDGQ
jgi:hypothetical protein